MRKPTAEEWSKLAELIRDGVVGDDESEFALGIIQRWDAGKNPNLVAFYRYCKARTNKKNRGELDDFKWACQIVDKDNSESDWLSTRSQWHVQDRPFTSPDFKLDAEVVKEKIGQAAYAVISLRYGEELSVVATAKRLGISGVAVKWIEEESLKLLRASSLNGDD